MLDKKIERIQWLSSLEDKLIIGKFVQFRKSETKEWRDAMSNQERASVVKGIEAADENKLNPHSSAKNIRKEAIKFCGLIMH